MPLTAADIQALASRFRDRVNDLHDDFVHNGMLWQAQLVQAAGGGIVLRVVNPTTKNVVSTGAELATRARSCQARLRVRCFKDLTAQFELFLDELLRLWLTNRTDLISGKGVTVATILGGQNLADLKTAAIAEAVEATILDKLKEKPESWFHYLRTNLATAYTPGDEASFVEMKARRDVLEHHDGIVEATYLRKCQASANARYQVRDVIDVKESDVDEAHALVLRLIDATAGSAVTKLSLQPSP